jgi:hypothetical protein
MQNLTRLMFLVIMVGLLAACQRQPAPAATTAASPVAVATGTSTARPTPTATPMAAVTQVPGTATSTLAPTATPEATPTLTPSPTPTATPLAVTEELTFELLAHEGGEVRSVAVDGHIAYLGVGPRLVALDVSNPASPQQIGRSEVLPGLVDAVVLANDGQQTRAYVGAGNQVAALSLGTDGEMAVEGTVAMPGMVRALALAEGTLYAGGMTPRVEGDLERGFVAAIDVRQLAAPVLVQSQDVDNPVTSLALKNGSLFYSGYYGWTGVRLAVMDVDGGQLGEPRRVRGIQNELYSLQVIGDTLLAGGYGLLIAFDIADPGAPQRLWQVEEVDGQWIGMVNGFAFAGGQLYLSGQMPAGAYIPYRRALVPPEPLTGAPGAPASNDVLVSGRRLYVAEHGDLEIYDISRPGELTQIGGYKPFPAPISDLALRSTPDDELLYLYAGSPFDSAPEELLSLRLPSLEVLGRLSFAVEDTETTIGQAAVSELATDDEQAYAVARDGIYTMDLSDPAAPAITGRFPFPEPRRDPRGVVLMDGRLYLGTGWGSGTRVDVAALTPDSTGVLTQTETVRRGRFQSDQLMGLAGAGKRLYVTTAAGIDEGWLHVVDVRDEMEVVATLPLPGRAESVVAVEGNLVATAVGYEDRGDELLLIDVSAPAAPAIVARVALAGLVDGQPHVHALAFDDRLLFAAVSGQQVLVVDVTEPGRPRGVGVVPLPSAFPRPGVVLAVGNGVMVAGSGAMGVVIFAFDD